MSWSGLDAAALQAFIVAKYEDKVISQINRPVVLPRLLGVEDCKNIIQWDVRTGTAVPASPVLADGADVSTFNNDTITKAYLTPGSYADAFTVSDKAVLAAAAAGNPSDLIDLIGEKLMEASERLAVGVAKDLYVGTGATDCIMGLVYDTPSTHIPAGGMLDAGTYAGLARGTYTQLKGNVLANGGVERDLSIALMREMDRLIYVACGQSPDLIVCDPLTFEKYGLLIDPHRRYIQDVTVAGRPIKLDAGFKALEFDGIPVVRDAFCPAGSMLFINSSTVKLRQLEDPQATVQLTGTPESQLGAGPSGFRARIKVLAATGFHTKIALGVFPQVQVKRPNMTGLLQDLRTS